MTDQAKTPALGEEPFPPSEPTEPPLEDDATVQHQPITEED